MQACENSGTSLVSASVLSNQVLNATQQRAFWIGARERIDERGFFEFFDGTPISRENPPCPTCPGWGQDEPNDRVSSSSPALCIGYLRGFGLFDAPCDEDILFAVLGGCQAGFNRCLSPGFGKQGQDLHKRYSVFCDMDNDCHGDGALCNASHGNQASGCVQPPLCAMSPCSRLRDHAMLPHNTPTASILCEDGSDHSDGKQTDVDDRVYYPILTGPYLLTDELRGVGQSSVATFRFGFPSFAGKGWTLTTWYRHAPSGGRLSLFQIMYSAQLQDLEFEFFLERGKVLGNFAMNPFFLSADGQRTNTLPQKHSTELSFEDFGISRKQFLDDRVWRHLAFQLDERSNQFKFFLDGQLAIQEPLPVIDDHAYAEYNWFPLAQEGWQIPYIYNPKQGKTGPSLADARAYVHQDGMESLNLLDLAQAPTPLLQAKYKCLPPSSPDLLDTDWQDSQGRDCQWYYNARQKNPVMCDLAEAIEKCPTSCESRTECFSGVKSASNKVYFAFDRVRLIDADVSHPNGSLCLGNTYTRQDIVQQCRDWLASGEIGSLGGRTGAGVSRDTGQYKNVHDRALSHWLDTVLHVEGKHVNISDCEELNLAIDTACGFEVDQVEHFTREAKSSQGYSLAFWLKPIGNRSLSDSGSHTILH